MKKFNDYFRNNNIKPINEADIYLNMAVPQDYLKNIKGGIENKIKNEELPPVLSYVNEVKKIQKGHEEELVDIAKEILLKEYPMLEHVNLDIKITDNPYEDLKKEDEDEDEEQDFNFERGGEPDEDEDEDEDEDDEKGEEDDEDKDISGKELKKLVDKRKLANNIAQGEGKNTHRIIHLEEVKNRLNEIDSRLFELYDKILKGNEYVEWMVPAKNMEQTWKKAPQNMAGINIVKWEETGKENDDESNKGKDKGESEQEQEEESEEERARRILQDLEKGEDIEDNEEDIEELFSESKPVIKVRALDFPMVIHEVVKGVYELIIQRAYHDNKDVQREIMEYTDTVPDEIQDLKYGPYIARNLKEFVFSNEDAHQHEDAYSYILGYLMEVDTDDFLRIIKGVLQSTIQIPDNSVSYDPKKHKNDMEPEDDDVDLDSMGDDDDDDEITINYVPFARKKIDEIINQVNNELSEYEQSQMFDQEEEEEEEEDDKGYGEEEEQDDYTSIQSTQKEEEQDDDEYYSQMTQDELADAMIDAHQKGDEEKKQKIKKYLDQSESFILHEKRKRRKSSNKKYSNKKSSNKKSSNKKNKRKKIQNFQNYLRGIYHDHENSSDNNSGDSIGDAAGGDGGGGGGE